MSRVALSGAIVISLLATMDRGGAQTQSRDEESGSEPTAVSARAVEEGYHSTEGLIDMYCGKSISTRDIAFDLMSLRQSNAPRPGDLAYDFRLKTADGNRMVSLSDLTKTKPVVLILSSWGCDVFRESLSGLQELYSRYSDQAHFVMVYSREIHPLDGFGGSLGRVTDAKSLEERMLHARRCREQLRLPFLVLVDTMMDSVAARWAALPVRAFVVDTDGKVGFASAQGPWGYRPYRGFQHGSGKLSKLDLEFSSETLEEFLEMRFPKKASSVRTSGTPPPSR